jgi:hypothetical protein
MIIDFNKPDFVDGDVKYWLDRAFTKLFKVLNPDYRLFIVQEGKSKKTYVLYENETPIHENENGEQLYSLTQVKHIAAASRKVLK